MDAAPDPSPFTRLLSRRTVLVGGAGALAAAGLAACAAPADGPPGPGAPAGVPHRPRAFLRTSWSRDPYALGSYSFLAPSDLGLTARSALAAPAGALHFAGEATSGDAPATAHGALTSGRRAADEIGDETSTVIVVGAGLAGLGAAHALADRGIDVVVVEARDRIGGRAHTASLDGVPADLGASWVHGVSGNPLTDLARDAGVSTIAFDYDNQVGADEEALAWFDDVVADAAEMDHAEASPLSDLLPAELTAAQRWCLATEVAGEFGADADQLAAAALDEGAELVGGDALLDRGYGPLVAELARGLDVRVTWPVARIQWDAPDAESVLVEATDARTLTADAVIVTVPLGVLQAGTIAFEPALPEPTHAAIGALGVGLLDKLWLCFDEVFWDPDVDVIAWVDPEGSGQWPFWVNGVRAFGRPVLLGFAAGGVARAFADRTDDEVVASAMGALARMGEAGLFER